MIASCEHCGSDNLSLFCVGDLAGDDGEPVGTVYEYECGDCEQITQEEDRSDG